MPKPVPAVAAIEGLPDLLRRIGLEPLTDSVDPRVLGDLVREASKQTTVVIAPVDDPKIRLWAQPLVSEGWIVFSVGSDPIPGTAHVTLPTTIDDLLLPLGRPPKGDELSLTVIGADAKIVIPAEPEPEPAGFGFSWNDPEPVAPVYDDFASPPAAQPTSAQEDDFSFTQPVHPVFDDEFSDPPVIPAFDPDGDFAEPVYREPQPDPDQFDFDAQPSTRFPARRPEPQRQTVVAPQPVRQPEPQRQTAVAPQPVRQQVSPQPASVMPAPHRRPEPELRSQVSPGQVSVTPRPVRHEPEDPLAGTTAVGRRELAPVIVSWSDKGGPGKTTVALDLAECAAAKGAPRKVMRRTPEGPKEQSRPFMVAVIDGDHGQHTLPAKLHVFGEVPTIYDFAVSGGDPKSVLVNPATIAEHRAENAAPIHFGCVFSPRDDYSDSSVVTPQHYAQVLLAARQVADLVIADTEILKDYDSLPMWSELWGPLLLTENVHGVMVLNDDREARANAPARIRRLLREGVDPARMMWLLNNISPDVSEDSINKYVRSLDSTVGTPGEFIGAIHHDLRIKQRLNVGDIPYDEPEMSAVVHKVLSRAFPRRDEFNPDRLRTTGRGSASKKSGGLLGGLFGKKR